LVKVHIGCETDENSGDQIRFCGFFFSISEGLFTEDARHLEEKKLRGRKTD